MSNALLGIALSAAVPLRIRELEGWTAAQLVAEARRCADVVAAEGDNILYRGAKRGDTARAFNALVTGLAVGAYAWGGIDFDGQHWEVTGPTPLHENGDSGQVQAVLHTITARPEFL